MLSEAVSLDIKNFLAEDVKVLYLRITYGLFREIGQCFTEVDSAKKYPSHPFRLTLRMFPERVVMHRKKKGGDCDRPVSARIDCKGGKKVHETKNDFLLPLGPTYSL